MSPRERLRNRRLAEPLDLEFAGLRYKVAIDRFPDDRSGEVLVANCKVGNAADVAVRDAGMLISLLLQHRSGVSCHQVGVRSPGA